jgi:hypothetical protein
MLSKLNILPSLKILDINMSHLPIIGLLSYVFDFYIGLRLKIKLYVDPLLYIYIYIYIYIKSKDNI